MQKKKLSAWKQILKLDITQARTSGFNDKFNMWELYVRVKMFLKIKKKMHLDSEVVGAYFIYIYIYPGAISSP